MTLVRSWLDMHAAKTYTKTSWGTASLICSVTTIKGWVHLWVVDCVNLLCTRSGIYTHFSPVPPQNSFKWIFWVLFQNLQLKKSLHRENRFLFLANKKYPDENEFTTTRCHLLSGLQEDALRDPVLQIADCGSQFISRFFAHYTNI